MVRIRVNLKGMVNCVDYLTGVLQLVENYRLIKVEARNGKSGQGSWSPMMVGRH